ncbi:hypothetical protein [Gilvimarinus chinensis]|uniref:hypothetical protein n=1 Tax=Gilvimarinus chinensis TaxID=396005 RepID=UPI0003693A3D|nr:hypothetical protein [Gilvimarinus chinensis]
MNYLRSLAFASGSIAAAFASPAYSAEVQYTAELYALGADVDISGEGFSETAEFGDILDNLEMGFFGSFSAKGDKFGVIGNLLYVDVENTKSKENPNISASIKAEISTLVLTAAAGWEFYESTSAEINGVLGVRWLDLNSDIDFALSSIGEASNHADEDIWDGVIGIQGRNNLSEKWYISYYADIGTGDSDFTWQATASLGYQFSKLVVVLGYQYLEWDLKDTLVDELTVSGPALGLRFSW